MNMYVCLRNIHNDIVICSRFHVVNAGEQFTSRGYGYYHAYNISFCGEGVFDSVCHDHSNRDNNSTQKVSVRSTATFLNNYELCYKFQRCLNVECHID